MNRQSGGELHACRSRSYKRDTDQQIDLSSIPHPRDGLNHVLLVCPCLTRHAMVCVDRSIGFLVLCAHGARFNNNRTIAEWVWLPGRAWLYSYVL